LLCARAFSFSVRAVVQTQAADKLWIERWLVGLGNVCGCEALALCLKVSVITPLSGYKDVLESLQTVC